METGGKRVDAKLFTKYISAIITSLYEGEEYSPEYKGDMTHMMSEFINRSMTILGFYESYKEKRPENNHQFMKYASEHLSPMFLHMVMSHMCEDCHELLTTFVNLPESNCIQNFRLLIDHKKHNPMHPDTECPFSMTINERYDIPAFFKDSGLLSYCRTPADAKRSNSLTFREVVAEVIPEMVTRIEKLCQKGTLMDGIDLDNPDFFGKSLEKPRVRRNPSRSVSSRQRSGVNSDEEKGKEREREKEGVSDEASQAEWMEDFAWSTVWCVFVMITTSHSMAVMISRITVADYFASTNEKDMSVGDGIIRDTYIKTLNVKPEELYKDLLNNCEIPEIPSFRESQYQKAYASMLKEIIHVKKDESGTCSSGYFHKPPSINYDPNNHGMGILFSRPTPNTPQNFMVAPNKNPFASITH